MAGVKKLAARQQFVAVLDGATVVVLQGARFPVASEVVKRYREMFEAPVEQATAAPGEKRNR
jgi:hypothetical protein